MFSKEYTDEVTQRCPGIQALWKKRGPRVGDNCIRKKDGVRGIVVRHQYERGFHVLEIASARYDMFGMSPIGLVAAYSWLPTTDNLLEELHNIERQATDYTLHKVGKEYVLETWVPRGTVEGRILRIKLARLLERVLSEKGGNNEV